VTAQSIGRNNSNQEDVHFLVAVGAMIEHVGRGKVLLPKRSEEVAFSPGVWENIWGQDKGVIARCCARRG